MLQQYNSLTAYKAVLFPSSSGTWQNIWKTIWERTIQLQRECLGLEKHYIFHLLKRFQSYERICKDWGDLEFSHDESFHFRFLGLKHVRCHKNCYKPSLGYVHTIYLCKTLQDFHKYRYSGWEDLCLTNNIH